MKTIRKSLPVIFLTTLTFFGCGDAITGVDQNYIETQFDLDSTTNPTILDLDVGDVCPKFEFDSTNETKYFLRTADGSPKDTQAVFQYASTQYDTDGSLRVLKGSNSTGSTYELKYDPDLKTYMLTVDYNCTDASDTENCTNSTFTCTGPLVE